MSKPVRVKKQFEVPEDALTEEAGAFLRDRAERYAPPIASTLVRDMRAELVAGVRAGERISDLQRRIRRLLVDEVADRIDKIVRTEVIGGLNRGTLASYQRSGVVERKQWLTARDGAVRGGRRSGGFDHRKADGQTVPVDQPFDVSGELLMHPGDPNGSPGNIIRCRCTMVPVLSSDAPRRSR